MRTSVVGVKITVSEMEEDYKIRVRSDRYRLPGLASLEFCRTCELLFICDVRCKFPCLISLHNIMLIHFTDTLRIYRRKTR